MASRTDPRKKPTQERSKATVDAIVGAATHILASDGYAGANVNVIAARAGVSIGSLYQYFPTKEAVVAEVIRRHSRAMIHLFEDGLPDLATAPFEEAVRAVVARSLRAYALDPALRRVVLEEVPALEPFTRSREFDERISTIIGGYLEFHRASIRPRDITMAVEILMTAVEAVARRYAVLDPARLRSPELHDEVSALVLGYLVG